MKRAIIPRRGAFSFFDYKAIEPRLFSYFVAKGLGDDSLAQWFRDGKEFYTEVAGKVYGKPADDITKDERELGKVVFLMTLYTAGPRKIAEATGLPYAEAKEFYIQFHERFPQIRALSNPPPRSGGGWSSYEPGLIERTIRKRGYLKAPWGRHLHVPQFGEHLMLNTLIQGSAADLMKLALIRVHEWERTSHVWSRPVLTVHDEIVIDGPECELEQLHEEIPGLMTDFPEITEWVPLGVDHEVSLTNMAEKMVYEEWKESSDPRGLCVDA